MRLFETLDRLDDRVLGHLHGAQRGRQADKPAQVMADLACRASGFLRDHPVLFGVLISLDLFNIVTNLVYVITAHTASQSAFRVGQLVGRGQRRCHASLPATRTSPALTRRCDGRDNCPGACRDSALHPQESAQPCRAGGFLVDLPGRRSLRQALGASPLSGHQSVDKNARSGHGVASRRRRASSRFRRSLYWATDGSIQ